MRPKFLFAVAALSVAALFLAGCGSDDDGGGDATSTTEAQEGTSADAKAAAEEIGNEILVLAGEDDASPRDPSYVETVDDEQRSQEGIELTYESSTYESDGTVTVTTGGGDSACLTVPETIDGVSEVSEGSC